MSNPSKDPEFNDALKRMLDAKPTQNKDLKLDKTPPKAKKAAKPWPWTKG